MRKIIPCKDYDDNKPTLVIVPQGSVMSPIMTYWFGLYIRANILYIYKYTNILEKCIPSYLIYLL